MAVLSCIRSTRRSLEVSGERSKSFPFNYLRCISTDPPAVAAKGTPLPFLPPIANADRVTKDRPPSDRCRSELSCQIFRLHRFYELAVGNASRIATHFGGTSCAYRASELRLHRHQLRAHGTARAPHRY